MWVEALEIGNLRKLLATEILKIGVEGSIGRGSDLYIRGLAGDCAGAMKAQPDATRAHPSARRACSVNMRSGFLRAEMVGERHVD